MAPVNDPRTWPKSWLSMMVSGIAPQLTGTKGCPRRELWRWIHLARCSLPTPVSPVIRIVQLEAAARFTSSIHSLLGVPCWAPMLFRASASKRSKTYEPRAIERSSLSSLRPNCCVSLSVLSLALVAKESAGCLWALNGHVACRGRRPVGGTLLWRSGSNLAGDAGIRPRIAGLRCSV